MTLYTDEAVNSFVREVLRETTGLPGTNIIRADQTTPQPATRPFIAVKVISAKPTGTYSRHYENLENDVDFDLSEVICNQIEATVSINFFGDEGTTIQTMQDLAEQVRTSFDFTRIQILFNERGYGLGPVSDVRNLTNVFNGQENDRAQMDIIVRTTSETADKQYAIEKFNVCGVFDEHGKTYDVNVEYNNPTFIFTFDAQNLPNSRVGGYDRGSFNDTIST